MSRIRRVEVDGLVLLIAVAKLVFHLLTANRYGIFRDELYYLATAEHLDWGYVDQPPMIAFLTWFSTHAFGNSLLALRLLPALAGAALVMLTGILATELGGGRAAQRLAGLAVAIAPIYLLMHHWMTMNAFEPLLWMGCAWCVLRAINTSRPHYWLVFGLVAGIGMETKYSMSFFVAGVVAGLLFTSQRRVLTTKWFWAGAGVALLVFLPNLLWLIRHDFPFLELMANIRRTGRDVVRGPLAFVADQAVILNPVAFPLWVGGLLWFFAGRTGRRYAALGWAYVVMLVIFIALKGKNYYLAPVYPLLFAGGAVTFETLSSTGWRLVRIGYVSLIILSGTVLAPLTSPILSAEASIRYQRSFGSTIIRAENQQTGPLPQYFADEFGWEEMARQVAQIYNSLPADQRASTAIFANNYGEAGAVDFFGPKYGLPKAISNHQSYWLWGPRAYSGETVIVLGSDGSGDREHFRQVEIAGHAQHPFSRKDEHFDIFLCRGLTSDLHQLWPKLKKWN